jgi:hypothetical protein
MTCSDELDQITRLCQLGVDEMATKELNEAKILFGQLSPTGGEKFGRTGFGMEGASQEATPVGH